MYLRVWVQEVSVDVLLVVSLQTTGGPQAVLADQMRIFREVLFHAAKPGVCAYLQVRKHSEQASTVSKQAQCRDPVQRAFFPFTMLAPAV